jgi:hypothetical protein
VSAARQSFSEVRHVKDAVRERDGYRCVRCGVTNERNREVYGRQLDVRLRRPGSLYTVDGCETVCRACNVRVSQRRVGRPWAQPSPKPDPGQSRGPRRQTDKGKK